MALDDILQKIREDGEAEAAAIRRESEQAAQRVLQRAEREAKALQEQLAERARQRAAERADRLITLAELDHRKAVLAEKQRAINEAFAAARERLTQLPPAEAAGMLRAVIAERMETGREEIVPGRKQTAVFDDGFLRELNASLGDRGNLRLAAEPGDFDYGVVLREGRKEINIRLDVLIAEAREQLAHSIAQRLFPPAESHA